MSTLRFLDAFLLDREASNLSDRTVQFYYDNLRPFFSQVGTPEDEVSANEIRQHIVALRNKGLSPSSQSAFYRSVRAFYNFMVGEGILQSSPVDNVQSVKVPENQLDPYTDDEVKALLKACQSIRDEAIVYCLLDTGCRAEELVSLDAGDVDVRIGTVDVRHGKGGSHRTVYLGAKARRSISRYLLSRKTEPTDPLFLSMNTGGRLTRYGLSQVLKRLGQRAEVHAGCHKFRRTFAIMSLRSGMNIFVLQRLMGHADISTLRHYLKFVDNDLATAHKQHSPGDNL